MKFWICILILSILWKNVARATDIIISWTAVEKYADGSIINPKINLKYNVWRSTRADLSNAIKLNTLINPINQTNKNYIFVDTSFVRGRNYYYFISAENVGLIQNSDIIMIKYSNSK